MNKEYNVIIVGGGTAGASLGLLLAKSGVEVAVLDRKPRDRIGDKVCGDAIAEHHFEATGLPKPPKQAIVYYVKGIRVFPIDIDYKVTIRSRYGGYVVDRLGFGQFLINEAERNGAHVIPNTRVTDLIVKNGYAVGVKTIDHVRNREINYYGRVIVDASGYQSILVKKVPEEWGWEKEIDIRDKIAAYREITRLGAEFPDKGYIWIHFIDKYAPGGYVWIFPHSHDNLYANVGNGIQAGMNYPKPQILIEQYKKEYSKLRYLFNDSEVLVKGQWPIPNRRPRGKLAGNGFIAIGDAAIQIDPATAEGIGYGMYGAYIASNVIIDALEDRDVSLSSLWRYSHGYMTSKYGVNQARFDVFRYLLQAFGDDARLFAIKHKILREEELSAARDSDIEIAFFSKIARFMKGLIYGHLNVLKVLNYVFRMMNQVKEHYLSYPLNPDNYEIWKKKEVMLFDEIKKTLPPYIPEIYR